MLIEISADRLPQLPAFERGDGAHRGVSDWYDDKETALLEAIASRQPFTTGWYGSKHEIRSARISFDGERFFGETSCSDDFDQTGNYADEIILEAGVTTPEQILEAIRDSLDVFSDCASDDQSANTVVAMYAIGKAGPGQPPRRANWLETFLVDLGCEYTEYGPPGDYYHNWGWQHDTGELPPEVAKQLEPGMLQLEPRVEAGGWIAERCDK